MRLPLLLAAILLPGAPRAEEPRPLSWEDCVALAAERNPDLAASRGALEAGRASYRGSFNALLPQVSLSNSWSDASGLAAGSHRWQAQGSVSLDLFNARSNAAIRSAAAGLSSAEAALRLASADLRRDLRRAFAQLLFAQDGVEVSRSILALRRRGAELVGLRYESGRESKGNRLRSRAQAAQAEAELAQSLRELRSARAALDRRLGLDVFARAAATGTLETAAVPPPPDDAAALLASRPDVAAAEASVRAARAGLSSARGTLWPRLSADYTRSRLGPSEFPSARTSWSAGATLSLPLFGGGPTAAYHDVSRARSSLEKAEAELRAARAAAAADLEAAWAAFAGAADQVEVQRALLEAARQRNDEADVRYASGLLSYDNWEIIASDRIGSERRSLSARFDAAAAEAAWQRATGRLLGE